MTVLARSDNDQNPGCDKGWVWIERVGRGVVRPCEEHLPATHAGWVAGHYELQLSWGPAWHKAAA